MNSKRLISSLALSYIVIAVVWVSGSYLIALIAGSLLSLIVAALDQYLNKANQNDASASEKEAKMESAFSTVASYTNQLAFNSSRLADSTDATNENASNQLIEIELVATAMEEMSATVHEVASNTVSASTASQHANESAQEGFEQANIAQNNIAELVAQMRDASQLIEDLGTQSETIGSVLDVIKSIAQQTNLLALNAAIEAARAGEHGRGFAVVADEVRTLAGRTQVSAEEIEKMIEGLQEQAQNSVSAMKVAHVGGENCSQQIKLLHSSLQNISNNVETINGMNIQIATASEEQSAVADEISQNLTRVRDISNHTVLMADQARKDVEGVAEISVQLTQLIKQSGIEVCELLDLTSAKAAHLNWKTKIRSYLDGKSSLREDQALSHKHCELGKWYYTDGLENFGNIKALKDLEKPHEELHALIRDIIQEKQKGNMAKAEEKYRLVLEYSNKVVELLDETERVANSR